MNTDETSKPMLLIVDDEKPTREGLRAALEDHYEVWVAEDAKAAMGLLEEEDFAVLLTDFRLPQEDGMKLIARAKSLPKPPICILMTAYGSEELAVDAMKHGADDYIAKGRMQIDELEMRIARALRQQNLEVENVAMRQQLQSKFGLDNIVGQSPAMREVFDVVRQVATSRATVLLLGESGTGKELVAKAIHQLSPRAKLPMVTVHCAALPPTLLESELFGHEKGAFTGAHEKRIGRFEQAQGGTLVPGRDRGDRSHLAGQIAPVPRRAHFRTRRLEQDADGRRPADHRDQQEPGRAGQGRENSARTCFSVCAWWRSCCRRCASARGILPLLAREFLKEFAAENNKNVNDFTPEALEALMNYPWPGNVRELRTAIESAVVLARGERIGLRDFPATMREGEARAGHPARLLAQADLTVAEAEKQLIVRALKECGGNRTLAAGKLGMSRRTLHRKLHLYHLEGI